MFRGELQGLLGRTQSSGANGRVNELISSSNVRRMGRRGYPIKADY